MSVLPALAALLAAPSAAHAARPEGRRPLAGGGPFLLADGSATADVAPFVDLPLGEGGAP